MPEQPSEVRPPITLETATVIGRQKEQDCIEQALIDGAGDHQTAHSSQVIVLKGEGGVGKSHIIRWAVHRAEALDCLCCGIVDFYHSSARTSLGIEEAILKGLSVHPISSGHSILPDESASYWNKRDEFMRDLLKDLAPKAQQDRQDKLTDEFVSVYNKFAGRSRILLPLDTAEIIQYRSNVLQRMFPGLPSAAQVKKWLIKVLPKLDNTVILLAGRESAHNGDTVDDSVDGFWNEIKERFQGTLPWMEFKLKGLSEEELADYISDAERAAESKRLQLNSEIERLRIEDRHDEAEKYARLAEAWKEAAHTIHGLQEGPRYETTLRDMRQFTDGLPIKLGLMLDYAVWGGEGFDELSSESFTWESLLPILSERFTQLEELGYPISNTLKLLAVTQRGIDAQLLQHLLKRLKIEDADLAQCDAYLQAMSQLSFVKVRPGTAQRQIFFHDELYRLWDTYIISRDPTYRRYYEEICGYFQGKIEVADAMNAASDAIVSLLHYQLRADPPSGYEVFCQQYEDAVRNDQIELAALLRDELQRYLESVRALQFRAKGKEPLDQAKVTRDDSVRLLRSLLAQNKRTEARKLAEFVLNNIPNKYRTSEITRISDPDGRTAGENGSEHDPDEARRLFSTNDTLFWAQVLTYYGEALAYLGVSEENVKPVLEKAIDLLK